MKRVLIILFVFANINVFGAFDDFFLNKTLRIDYYHTGTNTTEFYSLDELIEEPFWGGSHKNLIDKFDYGKYLCKVYDEKSGELIYSRTYCTLFSEWQTTLEAREVMKSFSETVTIPYPKNKVRLELNTRNKKGIFEKQFEFVIDPSSYFISREKRLAFPKTAILQSGDPATHVDIVFVPDGYTKSEMKKFIADAKKMAGYLFLADPYSKNKDKFNIWAVEAVSEESGPDYPATNTWKNTIVGTSFYTFDSERYLMTTHNKALRDVAANAPYDQIYIIVNSDHYGGGAIYNHYAVCISENQHGEYVFTHEFGHAFAGLGDEYYESSTSYNDFYPLDVEPWEPNLTTLVNFDLKWKDLLGTDIPIPTPNEEKYRKGLGVFEGGGYVAKGVYRPAYDCSMKSISVNNFCPVCKRAIQKMIDFYSE